MALQARSYGSLLLSVFAISACGDSQSESGSTADQDINLALNALENPILECQTQAAECLRQSTDFDTCRSQVNTCLSQAGAALQALAEGVTQCRQQDFNCLRSGAAADSGVPDAGSCRDTLRACIEALRPGDGSVPAWPGDGGSPWPYDGGLPSFPTPRYGDGGFPFPNHDASIPSFPFPDRDASIPSFPFPDRDAALPTFPFPDRDASFPLPGADGGLFTLPGAACLKELRECVFKPGANLFDCVDDARECLEKAQPWKI